MARLFINGLASVLILALGIGGLLVFGSRPDIPTRTDPDTDDRAVLVVTAPAGAWELPLTLEVDGEAVNWRTLTVGAEVAGRVVRKPDAVRAGNSVTAGDVLVEIEDADYRLTVERLRAEAAQADAELKSIDVDLSSSEALMAIAREDMALHQRQLRRLQSLQARGATTDVELDTAVRQELTSRNTVQTLQNQMDSALQQKEVYQAKRDLVSAQLRQAELDLSRCVVRAPAAGTIVDGPVEAGDYVMRGDPLLHLADSGRMEVKCSLTADDLAWIWLQQQSADAISVAPDNTSPAQSLLPRIPCDVTFRFDGTLTVWQGYLDRSEGTGVDRETRMLPCRIVVEHPDQPHAESSPGGSPGVVIPTLVSGMYVTVRIPVRSPSPLVQIPIEAVRPGSQVWVVRDGALRILNARPAQVSDGRAIYREDLSGLQASDVVVVSPLAAVVDGMAVRVAEDVRL